MCKFCDKDGSVKSTDNSSRQFDSFDPSDSYGLYQDLYYYLNSSEHVNSSFIPPILLLMYPVCKKHLSIKNISVNKFSILVILIHICRLVCSFLNMNQQESNSNSLTLEKA